LVRLAREGTKEAVVRGHETTLIAPTLSTDPEHGLRRREFFRLLGGAAVAVLVWPHATHAQQPGKLPTIGFLGATSPTIWSAFVGAFVQRLRELGWIDGHNIAIEYRWGEGRDDLYAAFAAEFIQRGVDVIVTGGTTPTMSVKKATSTIPIVFASAGDPVQTGLVASLAHPGGNVTGLSNMQTDLGGRRLELLRELVPALNRVAVLGNVDSPLIRLEMERVEAAAAQLGLNAIRLEVRKVEDIIPSIEAVKGVADALYVCSDPFLTTQRVRINTLAVSARLPTMHAFREHVRAGGLMSYGPNFPDLFRRSGDYVDKILRGTKPADIPVEQPVKFDLVFNNVTARALGLTIPESFMVHITEMIE
jgi:putative ABC transport system substrate-binding protein